MISRELAAKYRIIPFGESRGRLDVAMVNPLDFEATDELSFILGKGIRPYIISEMRMGFLLHEHYGVARDRKLISLPEVEFKRREARDERKKRIHGEIEHSWRTESIPESSDAVGPPAMVQGVGRRAMESGESEAADVLEDGRSSEKETLYPGETGTDEELRGPERGSFDTVSPPALGEEDQDFGTESLEHCVMRLGNVNSRYDIASVLLDFAQHSLDRLILFAVENQSAYAINAGGAWDHFENLSEVRLGGNDLSLIHHVAGSNQVYVGPFPDLPAHRRVIETLGGPFPSEVVAFPMAHKEKVFYVLYGDNGTSGLALGNIDEIKKLTEKAALAFEMLIIRAKILFQG